MNSTMHNPEAPPSYNYDDYENKVLLFNEKSIRQAFIKKVYAILMLMLLVSLVFVAVFTFHEGTKLFARNNLGLLIAAMVLSIVLVIIMACCVEVRRKTPMNFYFLGAFTLCESLMLGYVAAVMDQDVVILAVGITAVICIGLTLFAFQTKWDFTGMGPYIFVIGLAFMIVGFVSIFYRGEVFNLVYCCIGVIVFSIYLVYDTQIMIGGTHKCAISPEEYVFAALQLYLDILNILLYIMRILQATKS